MTGWRPRILCLVALAVLGACKSGDRQPASGVARRVVALTPSATQVVAAAGGLDTLVGVDSYSEYPPEVAKLPEVGDFLNPSAEEIVRLNPDLVVMDDVQSRLVKSLEAAGIRALVLPMHTVDDVREGIRRAGQALGTDEIAQAAIADIDRAIAEARSRAKIRTQRPRVLLVVDRQVGALGNIVAAGPGTFLDELLDIVGADNALAEAHTRYPKLPAEQVIASDPEVILDAVHTGDRDAALADWSALPVKAVRRKRVHALEDDFFLSPSPRVSEALARVEALLFPKASR